MGADAGGPGHFDSIGDFYEKGRDESDPLMSAMERWDHDAYVLLQSRDPELYGLIRDHLGFEIDIWIGEGSVKLALREGQITLTWNGDDEDLLELVLEGSALIGGVP